MTVQELIDKLKEHDPKANVVMFIEGTVYDVRGVWGRDHVYSGRQWSTIPSSVVLSGKAS